MKIASRRQSTLHLQIGQETIYLLLTLGIFTAVILALYVVRQQRHLQQVERELSAAQLEVDETRRELSSVQEKLAASRPDKRSLPKASEDQPPIVTLPETEGFTFDTGSAGISVEFEERLRAKVDLLQGNAEKYATPIIEVIGHTDERPFRDEMRGNLDRTLIGFFIAETDTAPIASDNVGLGMARATAVARKLREFGFGGDYTIIPMSAGPLVQPGDIVTDGSEVVDDRTRRRIEIRLRRPNRSQ